jgi:hypothetical protein
MPSIEYRPDRPKPYRARYWAPDGKLHSRSFARKDDAQRWLTNEEASKLKGSWNVSQLKGRAGCTTLISDTGSGRRERPWRPGG